LSIYCKHVHKSITDIISIQTLKLKRTTSFNSDKQLINNTIALPDSKIHLIYILSNSENVINGMLNHE